MRFLERGAALDSRGGRSRKGNCAVAETGGRFVAEFGGKGNIQTLVKAFHRAFAGLGMSEPEDVSPWFYPGIAEYAALLEKHGLEVRSAALFERPTVLEDGARVGELDSPVPANVRGEDGGRGGRKVDPRSGAAVPGGTVPRRGLGAGLPQTANYRL